MKIFRSNLRTLAKWTARLCAIQSIFLLAATVIIQLSADRFPSYFEFIASVVLVPLATFLSAIVFFWVASLLFPVKLYETGVRCYNVYGFYKTVRWEDMESAKLMRILGFQYVSVSAPSLGSPITIPTHLRNIDTFHQLVVQHAGIENPLAQTLESVSHKWSNK